MTALRQEDDAPRGFVTMREYLKLQRRCEELEYLLADRRDEERDEADEQLIHALRLRLGVSPQGAKALIALAHARRQPVLLDSMSAAMGGATEGCIKAVCHLLNRQAEARGAPRLVRGYRGNRFANGGGRFITPEGRAWLEERVPELFAKGGTP